MRALQWGRVLTNAETSCAFSGPGRDTMLQWGRVLTNAETWLRRGRSFTRLCFNGAAFSRTRKQILLSTDARASRKLQWGRVLTNAETPRDGREAVTELV